MIKQILVPTDGSENSLAAADYAVSIARINKASIQGLFVKDIKVSPVRSSTTSGQALAAWCLMEPFIKPFEICWKPRPIPT